jgi:putative Holliday junction resolvase
MRYLGVDFGRKRIGLALSDAAAVLASPWRTVPAAGTPRAAAKEVVAALAALEDPLDVRPPIAGIVVGLPRRLDGSDNDASGPAREMAAALRALTGIDVHLQDERLSSREAESRLALRERDWRKRKTRIDAAAAAVILQDYLDARAGVRAPTDPAQ